MRRRAIFVTFSLLLFSSILLSFQANDKKSSGIYHVGGQRHGQSYFPLVDYIETHPKVWGEMDFEHYHKDDEVHFFLKKWEKEYPDLVDLYAVGKSFEGRDILQLTISQKKTGNDTDKPGYYLESNRHSQEITTAESVIYFVWHVLSEYGKNPEITKLLDETALYIRIRNNPDGASFYLNTAQTNRSTIRPHDSDLDGMLDEDPMEDLDGDGLCYQMRKKLSFGQGDYIIDPEDQSGRLMKQVGENKGDYRVYSEGWDNDQDGRYNEDGIGGLDLNRNYPENWRPEPGTELTGRGWTQIGAGAYPLSEPETRSVVLFLLQHPNIGAGQSLDTKGPMILRGPSTSRSVESIPQGDLKYFHYFDDRGGEITGYRIKGDIYWDIPNQMKEIFDGMKGFEKKGSPLFGQHLEYGYFQFGALWYGDELWSAGKVIDYNEDGVYSPLEVLKWNDEALEGKGFKNWRRYDHAQLGEVEIGGYNPKFFWQNPPPKFLEEWIKNEAMFNLLLAKSLPHVRILSTNTSPLENENNAFKIKAVFTNDGFLPTALEMAKRVKIVKPDFVEIEILEGRIELLEGREKLELGWLQPHEKREVSWQVKLKDKGKKEVRISIHSTRGGVDRKTITLTPARIHEGSLLTHLERKPPGLAEKY
ncbi:MAG: peptidase [Candidatus Aminicenantes bacterium]|nr:peptidase [Candidatus Aminicenantes bacterium]